MLSFRVAVAFAGLLFGLAALIVPSGAESPKPNKEMKEDKGKSAAAGGGKK